MRIFLHDYGGYAFTAQLAAGLANTGHSVFYSYSISTQGMKRFSLQNPVDNLTIEGIRLPQRFDRYRLDRYRYLHRQQYETMHGKLVGKQIMRFQPDVVLSANAPLDSQRMIQTASRRVGAGFIYWMQDCVASAMHTELEHRIPMIGGLIGNFYINLERRMVSSSQALILASEQFTANLASQVSAAVPTTTIDNWAPLVELPVLSKNNAWSRSHGLADKFVFLYTGVLGLKHNGRYFISLAEAFRSQTDVRVVVVAEGRLAETLKMQAVSLGLQNLIILPYQPVDDYAQMLAAADVLVTVLNQPAGRYSIPSKVYGYMCAARPQLLSIDSEHSISKLIEEYGVGLVSSPDDVAGWISHADRLYQNQLLRQQMGECARAYAEEKFDIDAIVNRFLSVINRVVEG